MNTTRRFWLLAAIAAVLVFVKLAALPIEARGAAARPSAVSRADSQLTTSEKDCRQFETGLFILAKHRQRRGLMTAEQWRMFQSLRRHVRQLGKHPGALAQFREAVAFRICQQTPGRDIRSVSLIEILQWIIEHPDEIAALVELIITIISLFAFRWAPVVLLV